MLTTLGRSGRHWKRSRLTMMLVALALTVSGLT